MNLQHKHKSFSGNTENLQQERGQTQWHWYQHLTAASKGDFSLAPIFKKVVK